MDQSVTSVSLLLRIRRSVQDQTAWQDFVERYGDRIYRWCLNRKLSPEDAEDVTQNVLLSLARKLEQFDYDPQQSFRGWLRRVTENAITDYFRSKKRENGRGGTTLINLLEQAPARKELTDSLAEAFDLELLNEAKRRVQNRVSETRWQSWDMAANQNIPGKEVAERLGISVGSVYSNKYQIQNMISGEIQRLENQ